MGGQNIVFSPERPVSLNPFSNIHTQEDLNELMPMLKDLLRPCLSAHAGGETPASNNQLLEKSIQDSC